MSNSSIEESEVDALVCYQHPDVPTTLRCNRCNRPICPKCAERTPVGFRCPDCIMAIQDRYYSQVKDEYLNPFEVPLTKPFFTFVLLGLIVLIWLWMEISGGSTNDVVLISFGANYGTLILSGELWRLFTSTFLHIGGQHLGFNVVGLVAFGFEMERIYGRGRFLFIYLLSGLFGSLLSFAWQGPLQYSAGASGAIYGLIGMQVAFFFLYRHRMGEFGRQRRNSMLAIAGIGLVLGFTVMPVDNMGHIGGLIGGFIFGYLLAPRYQVDQGHTPRRIIDRGSLLRRWWVVILGGSTFIAGLWLALSFWSAQWPSTPSFDLSRLSGETISYNQPVEAMLIEDEVDVWFFTGIAGQTITIDMKSSTVDSYLTLYSPQDVWLVEDDDSGANYNALIDDYVLPTSGGYTIVAETLDVAGSYELTVTLMQDVEE